MLAASLLVLKIQITRKRVDTRITSVVRQSILARPLAFWLFGYALQALLLLVCLGRDVRQL